MNDYHFTLPIYGVIKQTKSNKNCAITFNWGRCAHFRTYSKAKKDFHEMVKGQIEVLEPANGKIAVKYVYYAKRKGTDTDNFTTMVKKFFQDSLTKCGFIEDDTTDFIISSREYFGGIDKENPRVEAFISVVDS